MPHRKLHFSIDLNAPQVNTYRLLYSPQAIRDCWGARSAIVLPKVDGIWVATWGLDENDPDFVAMARIKRFDPPTTLLLGDYVFHSKLLQLEHKLPAFQTLFEVQANGKGSILSLEQSGFVRDPEIDEFYNRCNIGWKSTLMSLKLYAEKQPIEPT